MTGVIYARYSSDSQREESIEGHLRECMAFAEKKRHHHALATTSTELCPPEPLTVLTSNA